MQSRYLFLILGYTILLLTGCGKNNNQQITLHLPHDFIGHVRIAVESGPAQTDLVIPPSGKAKLQILARDFSIKFDGVDQSQIDHLSTTYSRAGDGLIVTGTIEFNVEPAR